MTSRLRHQVINQNPYSFTQTYEQCIDAYCGWYKTLYSNGADNIKLKTLWGKSMKMSLREKWPENWGQRHYALFHTNLCCKLQIQSPTQGLVETKYFNEKFNQVCRLCKLLPTISLDIKQGMEKGSLIEPTVQVTEEQLWIPNWGFLVRGRVSRSLLFISNTHTMIFPPLNGGLCK